MLLIVSGPSGSGKGSIIKGFSLLDGVKVGVTATTRNKRAFERDGVDYFFLTLDEFNGYIKSGDMLEYNSYCGNFYGTIKSKLDLLLSESDVVVLEIDVNGAKKISDKMDCVKVFILPPSFQLLKKRLEQRGTETGHSLYDRLNEARREIESAYFYDYVIVNDKLDVAISDMKSIVNSEKLRLFNMKSRVNIFLDSM